MGRLLLLIAWTAASLLAGCTDRPAERATPAGSTGVMAAADTAEPAGPHAELACVACHRGGLAEREIAAVPRESCAAGGCHTDAGPAEVALATVTFDHRGHGDGEPVEMACAGCHTHDGGSEPLSGGTASCGLCHAERLDGDTPDDCRYCHQVPDHMGATSQGVEIPHEGMPWVQGECVRCHYDVDEPPTAVSSATCAACHRDVEVITTQSIGEDLHPGHTEVSCDACHGETGHRIVALSSAVDLQCSQCHARVHDIGVTASFPGSSTCVACHQDTHAVQQRLVLGVVPGFPAGTPSEKFMDGLTCRSCHVTSGDPAGDGESAVMGNAVSCAGCHRSEYATVLGWWNQGMAQRVRLVQGYLDRTGGTLGASPPDTARALMEEARRLLALVEDGHGPHNLPLSHALFEQSLELAADAARLAGGSPAAPPDLGTQPRMGLCSYCHYRTDDRMRFQEMDEEFHRQALGVESVTPGGDR